MLENAEDYFTELFWNKGPMTVYYLTLNLPPSDLTADPKPQLGIQFQIQPVEYRFYFYAHPPHHVRYGRDVLDGLQTISLALNDMEDGESILLSYSFTLKKLVNMDCCSKDDQVPLDNCQLGFLEKRLGCELPWMKGGHLQSNFDKVCNKVQLKNMTSYMRELWDALDDGQLNKLIGCLPACNLYLPSLTREMEIMHKEENSTKRLLGLNVYTDQLSVPIEEVVLSYDNLDAMADVGGFLGLLLGASCLSMLSCLAKRTKRMFKRL